MIRITILFTTALATSALAETLHVPKEHSTIQSALDVAQPGDVVEIAAGIYTESDLVPGGLSITVRGAINSDGTPAVTIDGAGEGIIFIFGVNGTDGAVIENIHFTGSTGNAIWIYHHSPIIRNCTFTGLSTGSDGGAIWSSDTEAIIENCRFVNNDGGEGNIFFSKAKSDGPGPTIRGCVFEGNTAHSTAVIWYCNPVIEQCTFESNTSPDFFGATVRLLNSAATLSDCVFTGNVGSGIGAEYAEGLQILDCTFSNNAVAYGGGVRLSGTSGVDSALISGCRFMNHVSPVSELGSALNSSGIDLTVSECEFIGNRADSGVWFSSGASYDIDRCHFENNFGGTCTSFSSNVDVAMSRCTFIDNSSSGVEIGGFSTASFSECLFENNHASWGPGGIAVSQTDTLIDSCEFRGNGPVSGNGPGAIYHYPGTLLISNSLFCENQGDPNEIEGPWSDGSGNTFTAECPVDPLGDINGDGIVDGADLTILLGAWGSTNAAADLNGDGAVDGADLTILLGAWTG